MYGAPSSTLPTKEIVDGGLRMHSVRPLTWKLKDKSGKRCITTSKSCTTWWEPRSLGKQKAKALWATQAAKDREDEFYDATHQKDIQGRTQLRRGLWEEQLKSPVASLAKALECLEATNECCCGLAHNSQHLECPEATWAARRVLLLPEKGKNRWPSGRWWTLGTISPWRQ